MRARLRFFSVALALVLAMSFRASPVHAENLPALAGRVHKAWLNDGAVAHVLAARFLFDDEITSIALPEGSPDRPCATVAAISARGVSTELWVGTRERAADQGLSRASSAGIVELRMPCGTQVKVVSLGSHAGRGAVEMVVAWHRGPLTPVAEILNERASGEIPTPFEVGPAPWPAELDRRVASFESRSIARGLAVRPRRVVHVVAGTVTRAQLPLEAGCHAFRLFTEVGSKQRRSFLDLDADLLDGEGLTLGRDRGDAIDATLEACVPTEGSGTIVIGATPVDAEITVASAYAPLASAFPSTFGEDARARMARAALVRHVTPPRRAPVALAMGGNQVTRFAERVLPGSCYVAVVAATVGQPRRLRLQVSVGAHEYTDEHARGEAYALASFCTGRARHAVVEIESRGREAAWGFALYRVGDAS